MIIIQTCKQNIQYFKVLFLFNSIFNLVHLHLYTLKNDIKLIQEVNVILRVHVYIIYHPDGCKKSSIC